MKKIINIILSFFVLFTLTNCEESFLDKEPHGEVAISNAFENLNDFEVALNGVYSSLTAEAAYTRYMVLYPDVSTNLVLACIGYSNQLGEVYKWNYTPGTTDIEDMWERSWITVSRANNIINAIDDLDEEQVAKDNIKGQALFIRAMMHFDLVRLFAKTYTASTASSDPGIPVVLKTEIAEPERASVQDVYDQIIEDLTNAKTLIEDEGSANDIYVSQSACDALLARVYLTMQDYNNAIIHAENVIANTSFSIIDNASEYNVMWLDDEGSEIIFRLMLTATDLPASLGGNFINDDQGLPWPDYIPAEWLLNLYDAADYRYDAYFEDNVVTRYGWTGTLIYKYPKNPNLPGSGTNMPKIFRLSEMYLIAAEAYARLDQFPQARGFLNDLRRNRITGYVNDNSSTGQTLIDAIMIERVKELAFEGQHFFDLKRTTKAFTRTPQANTLVANDLSVDENNHRWLWPIPQGEINGNTNMDQNPNY